MRKTSDKTSETEKKAAARVEWFLGGISAVLLLGIVAFLGLEAASKRDGLPKISLRSERVAAEAGDRYTMELTATNAGETAAADLHIVGELRGKGTAADAPPLEIAECGLDYLPSHSEARAALVFTRNPAECDLQLRVTGFQRP